MNRHQLVAGVLVVLGLAACTDERDSGPSSPDLKRVIGTCDYNSVTQYGRALFGVPSTGYDLTQDISGETPGSVAATEFGFDIFAEIARIRDASTTASPFTTQNVSDAANLVVQTIACVSVTTGPSSLSDLMKAFGPSGAWEVRGGAPGVQPPVVTADLISGISAPGGDFNTWINGSTEPFRRAVFYGYPITPFSGGELTGAAAGITSNAAYEWSSIRPTYISQQLTGRGSITVCVETTEDVDATQLRIEKLSNILQVSTPVSGLYCTSPTLGLKRIPVGLAPIPLGDRLVRLTTRLLSPTPLYAAALLRTGTPSGGIGSLSPHNVSNPLDAVLSFKQQPTNGTVDQPLTPAVQVKAVGSAGSPWEGVLIQLIPFNNNGQFVAAAGDTATTKADGVATFSDFVLNKTGSYQLLAVTVPSADVDVQSFSPDSVTSKKFNIRP